MAIGTAEAEAERGAAGGGEDAAADATEGFWSAAASASMPTARSSEGAVEASATGGALSLLPAIAADAAGIG